MVGRGTVWSLALAGAALGLVLASLSALGLGGSLGPGETLHVQVVDQDRLGVVAGLATREDPGLAGLGASSTPIQHGWIVVAPDGAQAPDEGPYEVTDDLPFTDPNGATWLAREISYEDGRAWVVPLGSVHHDATLDAEYNWALVVDWADVPEDQDLNVHYTPTLELSET